jgi:rubrerythrin
MSDDSLPRDSILGILKSAINIEKFGIRYYTALSMAVDSQDAKELMKYLVDAEEKHQRFLENEFNKQKEIGDASLRPLPLDNLDEDGRLAIFSEPLDDVDPTQVGVEEALNYGINVEEKSIKFYNSALDIINDIELKKTLQDLIKFEHEHLDLLRQNLDEFRASGNWRGYIATQ